MYDNYGKDQETSPVAILDSEIDKSELISRLIEIRSRMSYRLSDEALSDVQNTNALINALYYR